MHGMGHCKSHTLARADQIPIDRLIQNIRQEAVRVTEGKKKRSKETLHPEGVSQKRQQCLGLEHSIRKATWILGIFLERGVHE